MKRIGTLPPSAMYQDVSIVSNYNVHRAYGQLINGTIAGINTNNSGTLTNIASVNTATILLCG